MRVDLARECGIRRRGQVQHLVEDELQISGLVHVVAYYDRAAGRVARERECRDSNDVAVARPGTGEHGELAGVTARAVRVQDQWKRTLPGRYVDVGGECARRCAASVIGVDARVAWWIAATIAHSS